MRRRYLLACVMGAVLVAPAALADGGSEQVLALRARRVVSCSEKYGTIHDGVVVVRGSKILAIGKWGEVPIPAGARVENLGERWLVPGLVEPHTHIAGTMDINETNHQTNPELRVLESIVPGNPNVKRAVAAGVTSAVYIPGSGTNISGFGTVFKFYGDTIEEVVMRQPGVMKLAQAGNPERRSGDLGLGRMGMNWMIRRTLEIGRDYARKRREGKVAKDPRLENIAKIYNERLPIVVHTQIFQVVQSTIRILHDEMGVDGVIDHGTFDGYLNAPLVAERGMAVCNGPRQVHFDRKTGRIMGCAAEWWKGGVEEISVNTDAPVVPEEEYSFQCAMAVRYGLGHRKGLPGLTIVPARAFHLDHRVGSLEPGKDADLGVWTGDPIDPRSSCSRTYVNGKLAYDRDRDGMRF